LTAWSVLVARLGGLRSLRARRRRRRRNRLSDARGFIAAWDRPGHPRNAWPTVLLETAFGNINSSGDPANRMAPALGPAHPDFERSLERGVRDLVLAMVRRHGWITYTSCEGHRYRRTALRPTLRMVGILPRDDAQRAQIVAILQPIVDDVGLWWSPVQPRLRCEPLVSGEDSFTAINLVFDRAWGPWSIYFGWVDRLYRRVVARLEARASRAGYAR